MNNRATRLIDRVLCVLPGGKYLMNNVTCFGLLENDIYRGDNFYFGEHKFNGVTCIIVELQGRRIKEGEGVNRLMWQIGSPSDSISYFVDKTDPSVDKFVGVFSSGTSINIIKDGGKEVDISQYKFSQIYRDNGIYIRAGNMLPLYIPIWMRGHYKQLVENSVLLYTESGVSVSRISDWLGGKILNLCLHNPYACLKDDREQGGVLAELIRTCRFHWIANSCCNGEEVILFYFDGNRHSMDGMEFTWGFYMVRVEQKSYYRKQRSKLGY